MASQKPEPIRAALDTEVFVREQYDFKRSHRLMGLVERVKQGYLELFVTDVTDREIRAGIRRRVAEAVARIPSKKTLRILQNTSLYQSLPTKADVATAIAELEAQLDAFYADGSVTIIPSSNVKFAPIMDAYFNDHPPFEEREAKKHEFPDAISIAALEDWAIANGEKLVVVSNDAGVREACQRKTSLEPVDQTEAVLDRVTAHIAAAALVARAREQFKLLRKKIRREIADAFSSLGFYISDDQFEESDVAGVDVQKVRILDKALTKVDDDTAVFDMTAVVEYLADVSFDDPATIVYAEGDRYAFDTIEGEAKAVAEISVTATITLDPHDPPRPDLVNVELHVTDIDVPMDEFVEAPSNSRDWE